MNVKLLVIHNNINTSASLKQALEQTNQFAVVPFADAAAALDFLQSHPQDVVIVDMHISGTTGEKTIQEILQIQPDIKVVASTADSQMAIKAISMGASGLLESRFSAREVMNLLSQIDPYLVIEESEFVEAARNLPEDTPLPREAVPDDTAFERIAAEEPPLPEFEESGTITDFMLGVGRDDEAVDRVLQSLPDDDIAPDDGEDDLSDDLSIEETETDTPAQFILETAMDESVPLDNVEFDKYISRLRGESKPRIDYISEPAFLQDSDFVNDPFNQTTKPSSSQQDELDQNLPDQDTMTVAEEAPSSLTDTVPPETVEEPEPPQSDEIETPVDDVVKEQEDVDSAPVMTLPEVSSTGLSAPLIDEWEWSDKEDTDEIEDLQVAQLAVSLTQASLESTAEATLLTKKDELVAYEGALSDADIAEFMGVITEKTSEVTEEQARIRFLTLSSNGLDYMIYSRHTYDDYILSMIFEGKTPLKDIRQQGNRIISALQAVPGMAPVDEVKVEAREIEPEPEAAITKPSRDGMAITKEPVVKDTGPIVNYTFVWLVRDPFMALAHPTTEAVKSGLSVQLIERGWKIEAIDVEEDYVYIHAGVPGDEPPQSIARNLQKRAAKIAQIQEPNINPNELWADSYFVLTPGRELNIEEIQQYIDFYRT